MTGDDALGADRMVRLLRAFKTYLDTVESLVRAMREGGIRVDGLGETVDPAAIRSEIDQLLDLIDGQRQPVRKTRTREHPPSQP